MKTFFILLFLGDFCPHFHAQATGNALPKAFYSYAVDLTKAENDELQITVTILSTGRKTVYFCMPKVIPGIYGALDFGKLVSNLKATDETGKQLTTERIDENCWKINKSKKLTTITYTVQDGWDAFDVYRQGSYLSASSSFNAGNFFVINHNALFGYLEGFDRRSVELTVKKPDGFYGATSLERTFSDFETDRYIAKDYHKLVDNPILYSLPDTAQFRLGENTITVASHSSTGKSFSKEISEYIRPLIENQKAYLGGKLPVKDYTFLLYHNENPDKHSYMGDGLEHSNSTLILMYMPSDVNVLKANVYGIASHEFFHTIIPLGLQSEEIAYYDFNNPKLSKHLWMYEGLTEYFTLHMPVKQGLISLDEFLLSVEEKISGMSKYANTLSLTYLSTHALDYQHDYMNFYQKGALVNLCLDIELKQASGGKYGVRDLIFDMMQNYGPETPFKDDQLFELMEAYSEQHGVRDFFKKYVEGTEPLPVYDYLLKAGIYADPENGNTLFPLKDATTEQLALRNWWIGK